MRPLTPPVSEISSVTLLPAPSPYVRLGLRHHQAGDPVLLGVAALLRQAGEGLGHERLELIDGDRIDVLAAAEQRAETLHRRGRLRVLVAALLRGLHLLVALFELLAELLQLAERAVLVELHARGEARRGRTRCPSAPAPIMPTPAIVAPIGADHDRQDDRADDDDRGVADGLVLRALHQARQAEIQEIQAVEARRRCARMPSSGTICSTPATHAGVYEYTATFSACALFFSPPKVGASALMMSDRTNTPTIAMQNVKTARTRPVTIGTR